MEYFEEYQNLFKLYIDKERITYKQTTAFIRLLLSSLDYEFNYFDYKEIVAGNKKIVSKIDEEIKNIYDAYWYLINNSKRNITNSFLNKFYYILTNNILDEETLLNNYHVIPLHNNFEETNGTKPIMIFLNNKINNPYDSESYFVFDDDIKRKIYNAKDNIVGYFTDMANSGVVAMNVKFNEEKVDDQTIFSLINSYSQIELYANGTSLYFKFCNDEPRSIINNIDLSKWHFIAFSWTRVDLSPSIGPDYFIMQVYFDNTIVTYNINRTNDFTSFDLFIGTRMITLTPCKNFNGKLEMVTFNNIYHTIAMMNILKDKLKLSQLTRIYENNSLLRKLELKVKDNFIINNEYIYDTYNILENNVSRKYNTSKIKSEIISTLNYSSHLNYEYYEPNAFGIENVKSIYSQTLNKFIAKYEYNTRNFLTKEVFDDGTSVDYTYDYFGNVTSRNYTNPNISDTYFEYNHTYKGLLTKVTKGSEVKTITYQNEYLGNPKTITYGHYVINLYYEISNLIKYEYIDTQYSSNNYVIEYKYNHHNLIIEKKVNNVITNYYYEEERLILEETGNNRKYYLYDNIGLLYGIIINNNKYYYLKDMLNNIIGLVAEDGNCCVRYKYDSFGSVIAIEGDAAFTIGIENPIRYKGYYYDKDIRLYYCKSRFYNHEWGRWLSADEINYINPDSINGLNLFNYCDNNPVMYTDPNGNFFFSTLIIGSVVGGIVGAGVSAITQGISNGWDKINGWQVLLDGAIGAFNGALATSGIGSVASKIISGALGVAGSVGGDLINSNGNWNEINWGKAAILGAVNVGLAIFGGSNSQDATKLGKELLKNKEVSSKFSVLFNAVNDYASGTISKRGMTGIFNLYGKQFANAVTKNMHGLVAKLTTHSLGFSSLTTIATSFFGIVLK